MLCKWMVAVLLLVDGCCATKIFQICKAEPGYSTLLGICSQMEKFSQGGSEGGFQGGSEGGSKGGSQVALKLPLKVALNFFCAKNFSQLCSAQVSPMLLCNV